MTFRKNLRRVVDIFGLACAGCLHAQERAAKRESSDLAAKQEWFRSGRTVKGENAADLLQRGFEMKLQLRRLRIRQEAMRRAATSQGRAAVRFQDPRVSPTFSYLQWQNMGPQPIVSDAGNSQDYGLTTGRITAIAVDRADATGNTVYIGSAFGGVWKSSNAAAAAASTVTFTSIFETQPTLAIGAIGLQPNGNVLLVGTGEANSASDSYYSLGIFRSTDSGQSWTQISSAENGGRPFRGLAFGEFAFSTANPDLVVASAASSAVGVDTGAETQGADGRGIYYSNDAGLSWSKAVATDPAIPNIFYAGGNLDAGSTSAAIYYPATGKFYAVFRFHGVYSSTDGATWTRMTSQPDAAITSASCPNTPVSFSCPIYRGSMTIANGELFLAYVDSVNTDPGGNPALHILRLNLSGSTETGWTSLVNTAVVSPSNGIFSCGDNTGCGAQQGTYNLILKAVPRSVSSTDLFFGAVNLFKCSVQVGGTACSWQNLTHVYGCSPIAATAHIHPDQHAMDFTNIGSEFVAYFGNDGGVYRTLTGSGLTISSCSGGTNPFQELNSRLGALGQFVGMSNHPTVGGSVLGGTQDNGTLLLDPSTSGTNGKTFLGINIGDGGFNAIDPTDGNHLIASFPSGNITVVQHCAAGPNCTDTQFVTVSGSLGGDASAFYMPFLLDPQRPSFLLAGTCRIWRVNIANPGNPVAISNNFSTGDATVCSTGTSSGHAKVRAIAAGGPGDGSGNSQVIYAGTYNTTQAGGGHVFVTTNSDGGPATWVDRTGNINPSAYDISSIAVSPFDPTGATAYLGIMGFNPKGAQAGHIWKTTDFGATWTDKTADLPDVPVDSLAWDPFSANIIYAGTDIGVFVTTDDGASWSEFGSGLPNVAVTDLKAYNAAGLKKLRAATYGRGIWQIDLPQLDLVFSANQVDFATVVGATTTRVITMTNSGSGPVTVNSLSVSSGFSENNDCPATLNVSASCTITISFTPSGMGAVPGTLTINDSAAGSPHTVVLDGAGIDFIISLVRPPRPTRDGSGGGIAPGASQRFQVAVRAVTPGNLPAGPVEVGFECSGLPRGASCAFSPSTVQLGASPATAQVTVHTTSPGARRLARGVATPSGEHQIIVHARSGNAERASAIVLKVR